VLYDLLYCTILIGAFLLVFRNTNLLSCVMHLLNASGHLRHTTSVLAPAQQHANCITVVRRLLFPTMKCSDVPEVLRVLLSFSAPLGILVLSTKCSSSVLRLFVSSVPTFCTFCGIFVSSVFVWFRCTKQNTYQDSVFVSLCVCPCRRLHITVRSPAGLFSVISRRPHSLYRDSLICHTSVRRIAFWRKIKI